MALQHVSVQSLVQIVGVRPLPPVVRWRSQVSSGTGVGREQSYGTWLFGGRLENEGLPAVGAARAWTGRYVLLILAPVTPAGRPPQ